MEDRELLQEKDYEISIQFIREIPRRGLSEFI